MELAVASTFCVALAETAARFGDLDALCSADARHSRTVTWRELRDEVAVSSRGLAAMGLRAGTVVAVLASPSLEQVTAEFAVLHAGAIVAPLPAGAPMRAVAALARRWPVDFAVVDSTGAVAPVRRVLGGVTIVVRRESSSDDDGVATWNSVLARGRRTSPLEQRATGDLTVHMSPRDPAAVIAVGAPADGPGVVSHGELADAAAQLARCLHTRPGDRLVVCVDSKSMLERWTLQWHALMTGATHCLLPANQDTAGALRRARPTIFAADSRRWEELADEVRTTLAQRNGDLDEALTVALEVARLSPADTPTDAVARYAAVASALAQVRALVGLDECRVAVAIEQLPADVDALFRSVGLPIRTRVDSRRHVSQLTSVRASGL